MAERYNSITIRSRTPDGTMFVNIMEDNETGKPCEIQIIIGKAGTNLRAWTDSVSRLVTMVLKCGGTLEDIITELSNTTSDKLIIDDSQVPVRSGPDGFVMALMKYKGHKYHEMSNVLNKYRTIRRGRRARFGNPSW